MRCENHRQPLTVPSVFALALASLLAGCGDDDGATPAADAAPLTDSASQIDAAATPDAADRLPTPEVEPNNGEEAEDVNALTMPVLASGAIDPADDLDIFTVDLTAGTLVGWSLDGQAGQFAPHLIVLEHADTTPRHGTHAAPSGVAGVEHFVLASGRYNILVRDDRNVPADSSMNEGSPQHSYLLQADVIDRQPTAAVFPSRPSASLADVYATDLYGFTLTETTSVSIEVFAARLEPASDIDTRLSLYRVDDSTHLITNDDLSIDQTDSLVTGALPAGEYIVSVDNIAESAGTLAYEIEFQTE